MEGSLKPNDEVTIGNMTYQVKWTDESIETVRATEKNAVKAGNPPLAQNRLQDESLDEPLPIPDISNQYPVLPAMPAKVVPHPAKAHSLEIPDDLPLAPLDPPVR